MLSALLPMLRSIRLSMPWLSRRLDRRPLLCLVPRLNALSRTNPSFPHPLLLKGVGRTGCLTVRCTSL